MPEARQAFTPGAGVGVDCEGDRGDEQAVLAAKLTGMSDMVSVEFQAWICWPMLIAMASRCHDEM